MKLLSRFLTYAKETVVGEMLLHFLVLAEAEVSFPRRPFRVNLLLPAALA